MKIENKTNEEIKAHIVKMCDSYNKTGKDLYLKIKDDCEAELRKRAQKKSVEPSANQGQLPPNVILPTVEEMQEWQRKAENAKEVKQEFENTMQKSGLLRPESNPVENKAFRESVMNAETRVIGTIEDPTPTPIPVVAIGFTTKHGTVEIRKLTQVDMLTLLKTYFKRVATSAKMESKRYSEAYESGMGKMVYKLFQGWNMIYSETQEGTAWPPLADVFPGLSRASQQQKVNAEILHRWASNDK